MRTRVVATALVTALAFVAAGCGNTAGSGGNARSSGSRFDPDDEYVVEVADVHTPKTFEDTQGNTYGLRGVNVDLQASSKCSIDAEAGSKTDSCVGQHG